MGRWAQRSRAGGGVTPLNFMISGRRADNFNWRITYASAVDAAALSPAAFTTNAGGVTTSLITQIGTREINIIWDDTTTGEVSVTYNGVTPGIQTPQTLVVP